MSGVSSSNYIGQRDYERGHVSSLAPGYRSGLTDKGRPTQRQSGAAFRVGLLASAQSCQQPVPPRLAASMAAERRRDVLARRVADGGGKRVGQCVAVLALD